MKWKNYSNLAGTHAFLSPSKHYWLRYDDDKLIESYQNYQRVALGTKLHALAADLITLGIRLPQTTASFNSFVNDAIGFGMTPEVTLVYSANCYGTADAIFFDEITKVLRIHDLKTGVAPGSMDQLLIYAAIFYLDYKLVPAETHLRIYQSDEIVEYVMGDFDEIKDIADKIVAFDKLLDTIENTIF